MLLEFTIQKPGSFKQAKCLKCIKCIVTLKDSRAIPSIKVQILGTIGILRVAIGALLIMGLSQGNYLRFQL